MNFATDTIINDRYRILASIGEGGFAAVYHAFDLNLNREVALKVWKLPDTAHAETELLRIKRESKLLAQLFHPNIIGIYALEILSDNTPIIVMEYLPGKSLKELILKENGNGLEYAKCRSIFMQVCQGLSHAHKNSVLHRDLSPSNILITETGSIAKIIDFGLSKTLQSSDHAVSATTASLTKTGSILGNPTYMSPEACRGEELDERSDIYALGCVLYEILCGHPMFETVDPIGLIYKHQNEYPAEPQLSWNSSNKEILFKNIALHCIQKDRNRRPASVQKIIAFLEETETVPLHNLSQWKSKNSVFRSKIPWIAAALIIGFLAAGLSVASIFTKNEKRALELNDSEESTDRHLNRLMRKLEAKETRYGKNSAQVVPALTELYQYCWQHRRTSTNVNKLIEMLKRKLELIKLHPQYESGKLETMRMLLGCYLNSTRIAESESLIKDALEFIRKDKDYGKNNPTAIYWLESLSDVYEQQGKQAAAEKALKESYALAKLLSPEHGKRLSCQNRLADYYKDHEKHKESFALYKDTCETLEDKLLINQTLKFTDLAKYLELEETYLHAICGLGHEYLVQKKFQEAEAVYRKGLKILLESTTSSAVSSDKILIYTGLAICCAQNGKKSEAEMFRKTAEELQSQMKQSSN